MAANKTKRKQALMKLTMEDVFDSEFGENDMEEFGFAPLKPKKASMTEQDIMRHIRQVYRNSIVSIDDLAKYQAAPPSFKQASNPSPRMRRSLLVTSSQFQTIPENSVPETDEHKSGESAPVSHNRFSMITQRPFVIPDEVLQGQADDGSENSSHESGSTAHNEVTNDIGPDNAIVEILKKQNEQIAGLQKMIEGMKESKEIEFIDKEIEESKNLKEKEEKELEEKETNTMEERETEINKIEDEKMAEIEKIKLEIQQEFERKEQALKEREEKLKEEQAKFESLLQSQNEKITSLENEITENNTQMDELKEELEKPDLDTQQSDNIRKRLMTLASRNEELEMEKESHENEQQETTQQQEELLKNQETMQAEMESLEEEKQEKYDFCVGQTIKKFNIMRANILQEHVATLKYVRKRKSLMHDKEARTLMKLEMRKRFKEMLLQAKIKREQRKKEEEKNANQKFPEHDISSLYHGEGPLHDAKWSPCAQQIASIGCNLVLHVNDTYGNSKFMMSLKQKLSHLPEDEIEIELQWNSDGTWLAVLCNKCTWIGFWNALSLDWTEFMLEPEVVITCFTWSKDTQCSNLVLIGTQEGDVHIVNVTIQNDSNYHLITSSYNKMDKTSITSLEWSPTNNLIAIVGGQNSNQLALTRADLQSVTRIATKEAIRNLEFVQLKQVELLCVNVGSAIILHCVDSHSFQTTFRKRVVFDEELGHIQQFHCLRNGVMLLVFDRGYITLFSIRSLKQICCCRIDSEVHYWDTTANKETQAFVIGELDQKQLRVFELRKNVEEQCYDIFYRLRLCFEQPEEGVAPVKVLPEQFGSCHSMHLDRLGNHVIITTDKGNLLIYNSETA